jgi:tRNA 5-methylaminomethyl-2-thiouridine biosynthesis bifunctional protein
VIDDPQFEMAEGAPYSRRFTDVYHSADGGVDETRHVFIGGGRVAERFTAGGTTVIGETGFGTGLNFLATRREFADNAPSDARLHYVSIERYPLSAEQLRDLWRGHQFAEFADSLCDQWPNRRPGTYRLSFDNGRVALTLIFDDAVSALHSLVGEVDVWYLDGFSPAQNPEMWTPELFAEIANHSRPGTRVTTFTAAGFVRRGLGDVGFTMEKAPGFGRKRHMLVGGFTETRSSPIAQPWFAQGRRLRLPTDSAGAGARIAVIGGGLAGTATARALAERGAAITIYEAGDELAGEGSGNPLGLYQPALAADDSAYARFYFAAWELLRTRGTGEFGGTGILHALLTERDAERAEKLVAQYGALDDWCTIMDAAAASDVAGVKLTGRWLYIRKGGVLEPAALCRWYANHPNIDVVTETRVDAVGRALDVEKCWQLEGGGRALGEFDACVIANAQAALEFEQTAFIKPQLVRGQLAYVAQPAESADLQCVLSGDAYVTPAVDGRHVMGATFQRDDRDQTLRQADHDEVLHAVTAIWRDAPTGPLDGRVGFRCCGPDRMPVVGPVPDAATFLRDYDGLRHGKKPAASADAWHDGLYVNMAHGARGIVGTALAAQVIADLVSGEPLAVDAETWRAVHPARFLVRLLKRGK